MKRLASFLAATLLFVPATVGAMVIEPGTIEVAGTTQLSYSSLEFENDDTDQTQEVNQFGIDALAAYYPMVNLGVGMLGAYSSTEVEDEEDTSTSIGPVVKYQIPLAEVYNLFVIGSGGYQKYEFADGSDADGWYGTAGGGMSLFLSNSVSFDAQIRYTYNSLDADGADLTADGFVFGVGLSVFLR